MSTWRKVCCCLFAAVCGVSAAFGDVAIQSEGDDGFGVAVSGIQDNTYRIVCVAVGDKDYGGNIADWPFCSSGVLVTADGTVTVPYPAEWGAENKVAMAFEYDRVPVADLAATGDYLTDGLVAHWDAVGATSTSEWVDLVGGYTFTLNNATVGNKVYAFASGTSSYGELDAESSKAVLGDTSSNVTVEGVFANTGNSDCYVFTGTGASWAFLCYYNTQLILSGSGSNPTIAHKGTELATYSIAYNTDTSSNYRHRDRTAVNGTVVGSNGNTWWKRGESKIQIGGKSPSGVNANGACSIGAIRIYSRSLEGWEMKYNADVDKVRFYGAANPDPTASAFLWERGRGIMACVTAGGLNCTVDGDGRYAIGETVTLTATPVASSRFLRWEGNLPEGVDRTSPTIAFEIENAVTVRAVCGRPIAVDAINRDAEDKPVSAVLSFGSVDALDTLFCAYGETDGGDDLSAWDHVENVRAVRVSESSMTMPFPAGWGEAEGPKFLRLFVREGVEARSVVKNGLAAIWDGIDNVATGTHATETDKWVDLIAGRQINLVKATIGEKSVGFAKETTSYGTLATADAAVTFEAPGVVTWECRSVSEFGLELYAAGGRMISPWQTTLYTSQDGNSVGMTCGSLFNSYHDIAVVYSGAASRNILFDAVVPSSLKTGVGGWGGVGSFPQGTSVILSGTAGYAVACTFQMIRVYTNELLSADAAINLAVDEARFKDGATLGAVESCTATLTPQSDVRGTFTIQSNVPHGIVTGAGEYEQDETVTLSVTMEEGYTFHRWLGDLPDGVDAYSPEITFTADAHRQIDGFIIMPWEAETDSTGKLVAISNSVWHFAAKVSDGEDGVTLSSSVVSSVGQTEALDKTIDLSTLQRDTGYRLARLGASVFEGKSRLGSVRLVCEDLLAIGDSAFFNSSVSRILPEEVFPNLETVGALAFQGARRFVAPKVSSIGMQAFNGRALTNFYPTTLAFPLPKKLFYQQANLRGDFVIDSPSTTIPEELFGECSSVSSFTFNSPVVSVDAWAFYECSPRAKFYWNVPAPKSFGDCAIGAKGSRDAPSKPVPQLVCATSKIAEGFTAFANGTTNFSYRVNFVPKEKIDPKFLTKQYRGDASLNRILGWLVSDGELNGTFRIWVVGPKQGGMLLVR